MKASWAIPLLFIPFVGCNSGGTIEMPNFIVIMADDMGYGDPGSYNPDSKIPTPHMDSLAAQGMRFTDAHSPSAVCTPTRYALLTGRYAWRLPDLKSGVTQGYSSLVMDTTRATIASVLRDHGYTTAAIGKWHLGLGSSDTTDYAQPLYPGPRAIGFDHFYGIPASLDMPPYVWVVNESLEEPPTANGDGPVECCTGPFWRSGAMAPSFNHTEVQPIISQSASDYIMERGEDGKPFFLYVPLAAPHTPWLPIEEFEGVSDAGEYGDFTAQVDAIVGVVMEALDATGLAENTILIMTSDNGAYWPDDFIERFDHLANHTWRGMKADIHEGGHRIPFIVRWPGKIAPGSVTDQLAVHTDIFATLVEAAGAALPTDAAEDSFSHLPVLLGDATSTDRTNAVHQSIHGMMALRQGPWKYIEGQGSGGFTRVEIMEYDPPGQLYNLSVDPAESVNLFNEESERANALQATLDSLRDAGSSRIMKVAE